MENTQRQSDATQRTVNIGATFAQVAENLSKGIAAVAIAAYSCGFLIVSLYHSTFGFIATNPFRARILAAGAWFLFLSAIPITAALQYRNWTWQKIAENGFLIWSFCIGASFICLPLFEYEPTSSAYPRGAGLAAWFGVVALYAAAAIWKKFPKNLLWGVSLTYICAAVGLDVTNMVLFHGFFTSSVSVWFFGIIAATLIEVKLRGNATLTEPGEWAKPAGTLIIMLLVFAHSYYPRIKASWGGGAPINATIFFTRDSPVKPGQSASAHVVEEADEGFYIVGPNEAKAIFVPRSAVAMIYFSDKVADSQLFHETKHEETGGAARPSRIGVP